MELRDHWSHLVCERQKPDLAGPELPGGMGLPPYAASHYQACEAKKGI